MAQVQGLGEYTKAAAAEGRSPTGRGAERINRQNRPTEEQPSINEKIQKAQRTEINTTASQGLLTNKRA